MISDFANRSFFGTLCITEGLFPSFEMSPSPGIIFSLKFLIPTSLFADASYSDPLGEAPARPKTAGHRAPVIEDEFGDEELGDDLLPE